MAAGSRTDTERARDAARLRDLDQRLSKKLKTGEEQRPMASHDQAHVAWRMVIELVAGLGIGFGVGFGLDYLFGTLPFLLVAFTLLGFAAGVKTMIRTAAELNRPAPSGTDTSAPVAEDDDEDD